MSLEPGKLRVPNDPWSQVRNKLMPTLKVVDRDGKEHDVPARAGVKVMETLRELDYGIAAICGGMCS